MNKNKYSSMRLVWIDLEMTGLNDNKCVILEVAMIISDINLIKLDSICLVIWQPESYLENMIPIVRDMHTKNGLLDKVRTSSISLDQAQTKLMEILVKHVQFKRGILAGNSVHIDRRFLHKHMPVIDNYLHYRHLDVSSIKILIENWLWNGIKPHKKSTLHTAMCDIEQSLDELKFYKKHCLSKNK